MDKLPNISIIAAQILEIVYRIIFVEVGGIPLIVVWFMAGGLVFTLWMRFVNLRGFTHAIKVVLGVYDNPEDEGEVSHFQALATALSATVGLGNIAGVAIAIGLGGPGAVVWMTLAGFLGMSSKFVECTLAQKYRLVNPDGTIAGGPMYYLSAGLQDLGQKNLGRVLAAMFAVLAIAAALGSSSIFQANQSKVAIARVFPVFASQGWLYGSVLVLLVGLVIIGGIRRIAQITAVLVPVMCAIYVMAALWVLLVNWAKIPDAIATIFASAFDPQAVMGGGLAALIQGFRRAAFSNEAGLGIAAIAHAAARTDEPIREGIVATLEPLIDTVIICNMTALVIIITGAYNNPAWANLGGAEITSAAFGSVIHWFPYVLAAALFCFAFSTMIAWGYYGELCWQYLLGQRWAIIYKLLFLTAIFLGAIVNPQAVIKFSDAMYLTMSIPNLLGLYFLAPTVARDLTDYWQKLTTSNQVAQNS
ncbi:amino acid carrier protein [Limnospira maxima CS-328]|uniref:Amino acid carrier protein n=1 Tax=Limnospira maxima CS-328 TaxID=513049 RepID=B5W6Y4_LIMMA|nr:alanine/glycine:cation symporter family protein [Limnospira maxima]EDZ92697.1 amino acid carrier protein [Limnospira maxima CS-328]MDC0840571.1 alanine/glycine:cation symporter family protein [Limnoraphis robusta]